MRTGELWKHFVREHRARWLSGCGVAAAFFAVAALQQLEETLQKLSYALLLILFCFCVQTAYGFARYVRKQNGLQRAAKALGECAEHLPEAENLAEEQYQGMLVRAETEGRALTSQLNQKKQDMLDYYSMWAHQIKTPIAALHLLLHGVEAEKRQAMEEELFKTEQYVETVLQYARLEDMSADLLLREYDIGQLVKNAVKKCAVLFIGSRLSLSVEDIGFQAVTDEKWFCFVVEQLLGNAVKYTKEGGIRIRRQGERGIVIEDDGIGIPESDLPRIFERGFTGYNGRLYQKSTGIGLYLCRQTADRLGVSIRVESRMGVGTRVFLAFEGDKNVR